MTNEPKSRLDRELDEILAKKAKEPIDLNQRRKERAVASSPDWVGRLRTYWRKIVAAPMVFALATAILAVVVNNASHFLAVILCIGSVAILWLPGILHTLRPDSGVETDVKYWRNRPYVIQKPSSSPRSPIEAIKRFFASRK